MKSELTANDLLDIIDNSIKPLSYASIENIGKRNRAVRDIIINHLDTYYHKKIIDIIDSKEIILKLKECKNIEMNSSEAAIRAELYTLRKDKNENINAFSHKFYALLANYDTCGSGEPLSVVKKESAFHNAIAPVFPKLKFINLLNKLQNNK